VCAALAQPVNGSHLNGSFINGNCLLPKSDVLLLLSVADYKQPAPRKGIQVRGRPVLGSYQLHCILPRNVLQELVRVENETEIYRTRIAANVLCEWAKQQQANRLPG